MTRAAACGFAILCVAAAPAPLVEVRNSADPARRIEARAVLDTDEIRLSGEARLTLTVEGPGPLGVTPPRPLITKANVWRVREDNPPIREVLPEGRERWTQTYRLSPLVPGKSPVALGALTVRPAGGQDLTIEWSSEPTVRVVTSIESPSADLLRPATDIEPLPPPPDVERRGRPWLFAIVPVLLLVAAAAYLLGRRKPPVVVARDAAWAAGELTAMDLTADRCAAVLRQYLGWRFGLPAETRTTPELAAALTAEGRLSPSAVGEWRALFDECDAARFSGTAPVVAGLADRARELVGSAEKSLQINQTPAQSSEGPTTSRPHHLAT